MKLEQLSPAITREIKMKEVSKMTGSLEDGFTEIQREESPCSIGVEDPPKDEDGLRYKSGRKRRSCVKLTEDVEGEEDEEEGKKKRRRKKARETSHNSHMMLRSHQSAAKDKDSRDAEKCLGFNNNENDGEEVNETSEEELDLRLELDEEELLAQNDEDEK